MMRVFLLALVALFYAILPAHAQEKFTHDEHYIFLPEVNVTQSPGKIEITEVFNSSSKHGMRALPFAEAWAKRAPQYVEFVRIPGVSSADLKTYSQAYYTLESLGLDRIAHRPAYDAIVRQSKLMSTQQS